MSEIVPFFDFFNLFFSPYEPIANDFHSRFDIGQAIRNSRSCVVTVFGVCKSVPHEYAEHIMALDMIIFRMLHSKTFQGRDATKASCKIPRAHHFRALFEAAVAVTGFRRNRLPVQENNASDGQN